MRQRWQQVGLIQRAHAHVARYRLARAVFIPHRGFTAFAADNPVAVAAVGGHFDVFHFAAQQTHLGEFDHGVVGKGRTGFALAAGAVAAVYEHGVA